LLAVGILFPLLQQAAQEVCYVIQVHCESCWMLAYIFTKIAFKN